jgi:cation diffusion facilitator family transporter
MVFTARIMQRPPNKKYVYGYEKAESIATKILSFVIFYAGAQMFFSSVKSIFSSEVREMPGMWAIYVTVFSIAGKLFLAYYQYQQGKKINSSMLIANAVNMRNDVIISVGVLVGLAFTFLLKLPILDSITGLIISVVIIKSAISIFMDSNVELLDGVKDESIYDKIFNAVDQVEGASNPHRVRTRQIGNMYTITLDVEADENITLREAHDIAEAIEASIKKTIDNIHDIVIHVEPKGTHEPHEAFGVDRTTK